MRIPFRQGIVQYKHPSFVQINFPYVDLVANADSPLVFNIASGTSDYLHVEKSNVANAWGPITANTDVWLYVDIDRHTAARTFGITYILPTFGATTPVSPLTDTHWFDTTTNEMKVWNGTAWVIKIRIFACMLQSGAIPVSMSINSPTAFDGTQVGNTNSVLSGYILFDADNNPMRSVDGQFTTSENIIRVNSLTSNDVKIASLVVEAIALVNFPAFTIVEFVGFGKVQPASAFVTQIKKQYGIVQQDAHTGDIVNVGMDGVFTNLNWDWTAAGVNAYLYNDSYGVISATPSIPEQQPVAIVVDTHTIMLVTKVIVTTLPPTLASDTNTGISSLSVPAIDPGNPIAVGDNDPRMTNARTALAHTHILSEVSGLQTVLDTKLNLAGGTMTGNLTLSGDPTLPLGAATKQYVDNALLGLFWQEPIIDPDLKDDSLNAPPALPDREVYIVGPTPTGAWAGLAGHVVRWNLSVWVDVLGRPVVVGDRFGVGMEYGSIPGGGVIGKLDYIAQVVTNTPGSITYTFTAPAQGAAVLVNAPGSGHFGHQYTYNGTNWVELSGHVSLDQLTDVILTTPIAGQSLTFNGTTWINAGTALPYEIYATGSGPSGALGDGTTTSKLAFVAEISTNKWKNTRLGGTWSSVAAISDDGTLWTWGGNNRGQLGDGTTVSKSSPVQIGVLTDWKSVSSGPSSDSMMAIKTDGTMWGWGDNQYGQLGDGTTAHKSSPVQVGSLTNWIDVASAWGTSIALKTDGTLWGCGYNIVGMLGQNDTVNRSSFVQIGSLTDWSHIACSYTFVAAVKTDGTLWTWGANGRGQLGDGTINDRSSPVQVGALTDWKQLSCGRYITGAIKTDGTLWTWGRNELGELGDSSNIPRSSPVQIGTLTTWDRVYCGYGLMHATKTDGTIWAWGDNSVGQYGSGQTISSNSPVQVGTFTTTWASIHHAGNATIALGVKAALTSVNASGGTTGLTVSGGPITTSGTLTLGGTLAIASGGTGQTTATNAFNALVPSQAGNTGKYLTTNGTTTSWATVAASSNGGGGAVLPPTNLAAPNNGGIPTRVLVSDGTTSSWIPFMPSTTDNVLLMFGSNQLSQLGDGFSNFATMTPVQTGTLTNWKQVAVGATHTTAVNRNGTLWTWGTNTNGQLGDGTVSTASFPAQIGNLHDWASIAAGNAFTVATKTNGTLWAWGQNASGQLGIGTVLSKSSPVQVGALTNWLSVSCGFDHTVAIKTDGTLWAWGLNTYGQLGDGSTASKSSPVQIGSSIAGTLTSWKQILCGRNNFTAMKTNGTLWSCGYNTHGELGIGITGHKSALTQIGTLTDWNQVAGGSTHVIATKTNGTLWAWGWNPHGELGTNDIVSRSSPVQIGTRTDWAQIGASTVSSYATKIDGTLWAWGDNYNSELGLIGGNRSSPIQVGSITTWDTLHSSKARVFAGLSRNTLVAPTTVPPVYDGPTKYLTATDDGRTLSWKPVPRLDAPLNIFSWGRNEFGQVGDGTIADKTSPIQIGSLADWMSISCSFDHTAALKQNGTMWAWGLNGSGQLGDGTTVSKSSPVQIGTSDKWAQVSCGYNFSAAIKTDGTLWVWGDNYYYQAAAGFDNYANISIPTQIHPTTGWKQVSCSPYWFGVAVKTDGTLWGWGQDFYGQLGGGITHDGGLATITQSGGATDWAAVAAGGNHSALLKTDGTLWTCGYNNSGQLGYVATSQQNPIPAQVGLGIDWAQVVCGHSFTAALKRDGTLWTWGDNNYGQLGDGTTVDKSSPIQVGALGNWKQIAAGMEHVVALARDNTVWAWGRNLNGAIGNGTFISVSSPIQIGSLTNWAYVAAGGWNSSAISYSGSSAVTSVGVSGGTTGLTTSGGPITSSGTITIGGTLAVSNGGTGLTALGTSLQVLRTNATATAMEWAASGTVTSVNGSGGTTGLTLTGGPITTTGTLTLGGTLAVSNGGTGLTTFGSGLQVLRTNATGTALEWGTSGTVTSVSVSGGVTGLIFTGNPITTTGTLTLSGTLGITNGGTGQTTANAALNALLPVQTTHAGNVLTTNGTNTSWTPPAGRILTLAYTPTVSLNWTNLDIIRITLTGNITITNQLAAFDGQRAILELTQDGVGNRTVLFTSETIFGSDIVYTPSTLPNKTDVLGISYHQPSGKFRIVAVARGY